MVDAMARGKKPPDKNRISDTDLLEHIPMLEAISRPDTTIEPGVSVLELTSISFARIAEGAVEQHAKSLRQGEPSKLRKRARVLIESTLAEACYISGHRHVLNHLHADNTLSTERYDGMQASISEREQNIWRKAAGQVAIILREIESQISRKGKKGKPQGAGSADALLSLLDSAVLRDAALAAGPENSRDRKAISAVIPDVVREYLRLGQLRILGGTEQEAVDRHAKRLRNQLNNVLKNPPVGGSSIIRKAQ
jgi:hypothetical protein